MTERKTKAEIIRLIPDGKASSIEKVLDSLEQQFSPVVFKRLFKSITADNGCEFSDYLGMERSVYDDSKRFDLYFAHPYRVGERGSNEHANGIIRRFFPKSTDFSCVQPHLISKMQLWQNSYPRKILRGKTPLMELRRFFGSAFIFPPG